MADIPPPTPPSGPSGAVPPPKKETGKVQPKKETVRINLPPKPTAAPTIKLPTLPPGGPTGAPSGAPVLTTSKAPAPPTPPAPKPAGAPPTSSGRTPAGAPQGQRSTLASRPGAAARRSHHQDIRQGLDLYHFCRCAHRLGLLLLCDVPRPRSGDQNFSTLRLDHGISFNRYAHPGQL